MVQGGSGKRESECVAQEGEEETACGQTLLSQQELISQRLLMGLPQQVCQPFCSQHLLASLGPASAGVNLPLARCLEGTAPASGALQKAPFKVQDALKAAKYPVIASHPPVPFHFLIVTRSSFTLSQRFTD